MKTLRLAIQMLLRDARAGELRLLGVALWVAVASLSSVGFLTERVQQGLSREATQLLGGDVLVSSDRPVAEALTQRAERLGLRMTQSTLFNSMASTDSAAQMVAVKAVAEAYPLRGSLQIAAEPGGLAQEASRIPAPGEAWVDESLLNALQLKVGQRVQLGYLSLRVGAVVVFESDRGVGFSSFVPRLMLNAADLPASGLIVEGSRVRYRQMFAGEREAVQTFETWLKPQLGRGERLESLDNARPEIRNNLDRAARFLRLAAMLAVVLAAVAVGLSSRRFLQRHLNACAVMRCFGVQRRQLLNLYLLEFLVFGLGIAALGCLTGFLVQHLLAGLAADMLQTALPPAGWQPLGQGLAVALVLVLGFVSPQLLRLSRVPPMRVIRREWGDVEASSLGAWGLGSLALAALMFWVAGEWQLGAVLVGAFSLAVGLFAVLSWGLLGALGRFRQVARGRAAWGVRYGLAALYRRRVSSVVQLVALALGLTAIFLLTLISRDLLDGWRNKQPPDAPNRFVVGIQPDQQAGLRAFFVEQGLVPPALQPMIRGRLLSVNERAVRGDDFQDDRAQRLVEREFNLSYGAALPVGNEVLAGAWPAAGEAQFSMEQGIGKTLGIKLGDRVSFDVAGQTVTGRVGSIRKLDWDSMRVNFFFIASPGLLENSPSSFITSFYLPPDKPDLVREMVARFPNLTVIDVGMILTQIGRLTERLVWMVQFIFGFALLAGLVVLFAAQQSTHDERSYEVAVLRALGARRAQIRSALLAEFAALGALAALLALAAAYATGFALANYVLELNFSPSPLGLLAAFGVSALATLACGWLGVRGVLSQTVVDGVREAA